jgi:hypothetical protein
MMHPFACVAYDAGMVKTRAKKSLGQHWLTDSRALQRIASAADLTDEDTVSTVCESALPALPTSRSWART